MLVLSAAVLVGGATALPRSTAHNETALLLAAGLWVAGVMVAAGRGRRPQAPAALVSLTAAVLVGSFAAFGLENQARPNLLRSETLFPNLAVIYLLLGSGVAFVAGLAASSRERAYLVLLAAAVVATALPFHRLLEGDAGAPLLVSVAGVALGGRLLSQRPRGLAWPPFGAPMAVLLAVLLTASLASPYPYGNVLWVVKFGAVALVAALLYDAARQGPGAWRWIAGAILVPSVLVAGAVLFQVVRTAVGVSPGFAVHVRMQLDAVADPSSLGLQLVLGFFAAAALARSAPRRRLRVAAAGAGALCLLATPFEYSLVTFLALVAGLAWLLAAHGRRWLARRPGLWLAVGGLVGAGVAAVLLAAVPNPFGQRLAAEILDPAGARDNRELIWGTALEEFLQNPLLGVGPDLVYVRARYVPDSFSYRELTQLSEHLELTGLRRKGWADHVLTGGAHNVVLETADAGGALALAALALLALPFLAVAARLLRGSSARSGRSLGGASALFAGTVATVAWALLAQPYRFALFPVQFWVLAAAAFGAAADADGPGAGKRRAWSPRATGLLLSGALLAVVAFGMRPLAADALAAEAADRRAEGEPAEATDLLEAARTLDPFRAELEVALAQTNLDAGERAEAREALARAASEREEDPRLLVAGGWAAWLAGDPAAAEANFRRAASLDPWDASDSGHWTALGLVLMTQGREAEAVEAFGEALRGDPRAARDPAWQLTVAGGQIDAGLDPAYVAPGGAALEERLSQRLRRLLTPATTEPVPPKGETLRLSAVLSAREQVVRRGDPADLAGDLLGLARAYAGALRLEEAERLLREAATLAPRQPYPLYDLALVQLLAGETAGALDTLGGLLSGEGGALDHDVRRPLTHLLRGRLLLTGDPRGAAAEVEAALDSYRFEYLPDAYPLLAAAYQTAGDLPRAEEGLAREAYLRDRLEVRFALAEIQAQRGEGEAARRNLDRAVAFLWEGSDPTADPLLTLLARRYAALAANSEGGAEALAGAVREAGGDAAAQAIAAGHYWRAAGQRARAQASYEDAVAAAPGDPRPQLAYAVALLDWGEPEAAILRLQAALQVQPKNFGALLLLGDARRLVGDPVGALESYERARSLRPGDPLPYLRIARTYREMGQLDSALTVLEAGVRAAPDSPQLWRELAAQHRAAGRPADAAAEEELAARLERRQRLEQGLLEGRYADLAAEEADAFAP